MVGPAAVAWGRIFVKIYNAQILATIVVQHSDIVKIPKLWYY